MLESSAARQQSPAAGAREPAALGLESLQSCPRKCERALRGAGNGCAAHPVIGSGAMSPSSAKRARRGAFGHNKTHINNLVAGDEPIGFGCSAMRKVITRGIDTRLLKHLEYCTHTTGAA